LAGAGAFAAGAFAADIWPVLLSLLQVPLLVLLHVPSANQQNQLHVSFFLEQHW
jgi:hypothetical protein